VSVSRDSAVDATVSHLLADSGWRAVRCSGRHAERFLNGQLTSGISRLAPGGHGVWFALLDVGGRLRSWGLIVRIAEDAFVACMPESVRETFVADLESRIIADAVTLTPVSLPVWWAVGPDAWSLQIPESARCMAFGGPAAIGWGGAPTGIEAAERSWWEVRALLSGTPWGIAAPVLHQLVTETRLVSLAVDRDKGCYLGQETVNKVLSGRGAARLPVWLELSVSMQPPASGDEVVDAEGQVVGRMIGSVQSVWFLSAVRSTRVEGLEIDLGGATARVRTDPPMAWTPRHVADVLCSEAARRFASDDTSGAESQLRAAISVDPTCADAYESLGVLCGRQGRYREALDLMDQLLAVDPDSVMAHSNKSLYFNHLGDIERAEDEAREAAAASVRQAARRRESDEEAERRIREAEEALAARERMFRQVLNLDSEDVLANFALGELLVDAGRFDEALSHLERAREHDPKHSAAHLALGRCLEGLQRVEDAVAVYRHGVRVASSQGDLQPANRMQARLAALT
jgi:folate-binding Fe-S cluster repair protein YgfZ/Tfp pilus assembly protein PilF